MRTMMLDGSGRVRRRRIWLPVLAGLAACVLAGCGGSDSHHDDSDKTGTSGPIAPLASSGRWFVDAAGRVVIMHGFNEVSKSPPFYPAAFGFGADDAAFLASLGFNAVRLGVDFRGLMPLPGAVDESYIEHLAESVDVLVDAGLFVLLDFHQDGFSPMFNGNGLPDWMAITDGLPNPPNAVFPLYYAQNRAMQRAFEHFWSNSPGPGGIGLQDYFIQGLERVVARFAGNDWVLGYELMNEPWPGGDWMPCILDSAACAELEQRLLVPFYRRATAAARRLAPDQFVFVEPFVLFNFGQTATTLPGTDDGVALSFHSYALNVESEESVLDYGVEAATRDGAAALVTEFGSSSDPVLLNRLTAQMEDRLLPWLNWAYQSFIADESEPAGLDNVRSAEAVDALVRPHPLAITGTPTLIAFDPISKSFLLGFDRTSPTGEQYAADLVTVVAIPARHYPDGYDVSVDGASVTSSPCARLLTLRTDADATSVSVHVTPATQSCRPNRVPAGAP